ncbi:MAG: hypothetical protein M0Z33_03000 [Actinomycetota bacterium]|nr:hypothetical protein [Actinomycetota bacterium]
MTVRALDTVRRRWELVAASPRARAVVDRLAALEPDVARLDARDLSELVAVTSGRARAVPPDLVNAAIAALVRQFECDELVGVTVVRLLIPGLTRVARSLHWGEGGPWSDRDEFESDLVAAAWRSARLHAGLTLERPCRVILERARRSLRTDLERHRRDLARRRSPDDLDDLPSPGVDLLSELAHALALLSGSLVAPRDVALLVATRVHGYRLAELAEMTGESASHLAYRRRLAEQAVVR